jgi:hypothetical protein
MIFPGTAGGFMPAKKASGPAAPRAGRPHIPDYGISTSSKGLLPWKWAEQRLKKSREYWFVTALPNGRPHVMPVWGVWVDSAFYFSTGRDTRKARNLARSPYCVVCNELAAEAVIVHGRAKEIGWSVCAQVSALQVGSENGSSV